MSDKRPPITRHYNPYGGKDSGAVSRRADSEESGVIAGRNAVIEALRAGVPLDKVYIQKSDEPTPALGHIASAAREAGAVVVDADKRKLDYMSGHAAHQGVVALVSQGAYVSVADIVARAREKNEPALIVVCDEISDPHNLGAIIRTAEAAGAHGVIIPKRRSASLTPIVAKTSAGAVFHIPTARVPNLSAAMRELRELGVWIYGTAADGGKNLWLTDFTGDCAVVVGSEGEGLGRLVREGCDFIVSIPMNGAISSLNASVSASLVLYEAVRQRRG